MGICYANLPLGVEIELGQFGLAQGFPVAQEPLITRALKELRELEAGGIANPSEMRMVGHYWLRAPELAPTKEISQAIASTVEKIKTFGAGIRSGSICPSSGDTFESFLVIGIGGSMLGIQFLVDSLAAPSERKRLFYLDNTDPVGIATTLAQIPDLARTLVIVISKSGSTPETRNGQLIVEEIFRQRGLNFSDHGVAITGPDSLLWRSSSNWKAQFPIWDWVGGRTSVLSPVGLVPAALIGIDIDALLAGAREMDRAGREENQANNPALLLALAWGGATELKAKRAMVVLPYSDRLQLLGRYLQQLVMESLGKHRDLSGAEVSQGLTVYGNKGSTDQHAFVQQLREGPDDFFVTIVEVLKASTRGTDADRSLLQAVSSVEVEPGVTAGDYLTGLATGTRDALAQVKRQIVSIYLNEVNETSFAALVALYERAVGIYASFINVNAYDQPGVEAGKAAAKEALCLQRAIVDAVRKTGKGENAEAVAAAIGAPNKIHQIRRAISRLAVNGRIKL